MDFLSKNAMTLCALCLIAGVCLGGMTAGGQSCGEARAAEARPLAGTLELLPGGRARYQNGRYRLDFDPAECRYEEKDGVFTVEKLVEGTAVSLSVLGVSDGPAADLVERSNRVLNELDGAPAETLDHLLPVSPVLFQGRCLGLRGGIFDPDTDLFAVSYAVTGEEGTAVLVLHARTPRRDLFERQFGGGSGSGCMERAFADVLESFAFLDGKGGAA